MQTVKNIKRHDGYFESLPETTREIIKDLMNSTIDEVDGYKYRDDLFESIECHSRDGFTPYSHNRGGLVARQFTDLLSLWGSGTMVSHKDAQKEIQRQIEYGLKCARESFFQNNEKEMKRLKIKTANNVSYHKLQDIGEGVLAEDFSEYETENLSGDSSSIMFEVRFMYHGIDNKGIHSASISCAVNTEGPYHRSGISWAPNVFCEGAKEVEINWKTDSGLERKLKQSLKKISGEVF